MQTDGHVVLIVEDDPDIQDSVRAILEDEGYGVLTAKNGQEALRVLAANPLPSAVLVDLMMPVMNGWELIAALKNQEDTAKIPVAIVSAMCEAARGAPVQHFLSKPISIELLLDVVADLCRARAA